MRIVSFVVLALSLLISFKAFCQPVSPPALDRVNSCDIASHPVTYLDKLDEESTRLFWADTVDRDGYLEVMVDNGYVDLIADLYERAVPIAEVPKLNTEPAYPLILITTLHESARRTSYFFVYGIATILLTRWEFLADGARLCFARELINYSAQGELGTLSLAVPRDLTKLQLLWKLRWLTASSRVQYELYVSDVRSPLRRPLLDHKDVIKLASHVRNMLGSDLE